MKKTLFIVPLMAISLLASCGGGAPKIETFTVTFDANGGTLDSGASPSIDVKDGTLFSEIPNITKQTATKDINNFYFNGWGLVEHTPDKIKEDFKITDNLTVYAIYVPRKTATINFSNISRNCKLLYNGSTCEIGTSLIVPAGIDIDIVVNPINDYLPVFKNNLTVTNASTYRFNQNAKTVTVNVLPDSTNCTIEATTDYSLESSGKLNDYSWEKIKYISESGGASMMFKIGDEKIMKVNGRDHRVRIIGFDQDVDKNGDNIGITFEFATLISDSDGYSIATQWNDTNSTGSANYNYLDSSVRMALVGEKQEKGHILWAQYSNKATTTWSSAYENKTVLNMIENSNPGFTNIIVAPKKTVECNKDGTWTDTPIINNSGEYDKLFLLSPKEMGNNATREGAYAYYQEKDDTKLKVLRVKKQFNGNDALRDVPTIPRGSAGQEYQNDVFSFAGYNYSSDNTGGGYSWLRSPHAYVAYLAWCVHYDGVLDYYGDVCNSAFAVAPAFCI